ncbi:hypothetical protein [Roseovarius azorensis]|uniref:hypothetical protein n=1 Tax=Roseovarius azorensis TaxID=1287727 RepID=UPI000B804AC2|nr:hypothetical protein [Roseovarius azorensis]
MNEDEVEGIAVARLVGADGCKVVGWVYRWNTGVLAVRWEDGPQRVSGCAPDLNDAEKREIDFDGLARIPVRGNDQG